MFKPDDMIVYGGTGVCRVVRIVVPDFAKDLGKEYYELAPVYENGTIYAPVDNESISMRCVMDKVSADKMIDSIPNIEIEEFREKSTQKLSDHYKQKIKDQDCKELVKVIISANYKREQAEASNRKFGQIDKKFMKKAEDLLFGELAIALNIDRQQVYEYICNRIGNAFDLHM